MSTVVIVSLPGNGKTQQQTVSMRPFGFHSYRKSLWGLPILEALGLKLIPRLRDSDLIGLAGTDLDELEREAPIIEQNMPQILAQAETQVKKPEFLSEALPWYTKNLLQGIDEARQIGGVIDIN